MKEGAVFSVLSNPLSSLSKGISAFDEKRLFGGEKKGERGLLLAGNLYLRLPCRQRHLVGTSGAWFPWLPHTTDQVAVLRALAIAIVTS